jgi:hypothetical protein
MPEKKSPTGKSVKRVCEYSPHSKSTEYKLLVNEHVYVCKSCQRSAASGKNLCRPERLYSAW